MNSLLRIAVACVLVAVNSEAFAADSALEYKVKAAYMYNFALFTEWPPGSGARSAEPFDLCVFGADPFGDSLASVMRGKRVKTRPFRISHIETADKARQCDLVFVGATAEATRTALLNNLRNHPVLTIGEADGFDDQGGVIRLLLDQGKVRFAINLNAANAAGLRLSSKLLRVAKNVQGKAAQ